MLTMLKLTIACAAVLASTAQAAVITFTNRAAWEAAVGSSATINFNAEAAGTFTSRDFGPFTAANTSPHLITGVALGSVFFTSFFTEAPMTWTFDSPISALGFDWVTKDKSNDKSNDGKSKGKSNDDKSKDKSNDGLDFVLHGTIYTVSPGAPAKGFFGVIETSGTFTTVALQDDEDGGGINLGVGFDNVSFGIAAGIAAVPEPATLALFGIGLAGLGFSRRKRAVT